MFRPGKFDLQLFTFGPGKFLFSALDFRPGKFARDFVFDRVSLTCDFWISDRVNFDLRLSRFGPGKFARDLYFRPGKFLLGRFIEGCWNGLMTMLYRHQLRQ